jgi:uncharacterized protein (TIGR02284 family)
MNIAVNNAMEALNNLIEICRDGELGYQTAANVVEDARLKVELLQYSRQRAEFATDLQAAMTQLDEEPRKSGSITGALHRGWINIKQAVAGNNAYAVLSECERGEDSALTAYWEALSVILPSPASGLVKMQYQAVRGVHDRIRLLRDAAKPD